MQPPVSPRPSLIIATADNSHALNLVLGSIALQSRMPCEILVADESTDTECAKVVQDWSRTMKCPLIRFVPARQNGSRSPLLNQVVRAATGNYLIFVDADCFLHRHFIADHLRHASPGTFVQGRRAGVRARYVHRISPGKFWPLYWFLRRRMYGLRLGIRRLRPTIKLDNLRTINSCNFAVWREDFIRVNGFNEEFDESGLETIELATRLTNAGTTLRTITGHAIIYHLDHRYTARYRSLKTARILEFTARQKASRCELGFAGITNTDTPAPSPERLNPESQPANARPPVPTPTVEAPSMAQEAASHFRDEIVPRSILARILPRSP
jgi:glycosyltransferase involved in cell wall biosynthesis